MCHHHTPDWTPSRTDDEETEGRPEAFDDDRDVDVEIVTDGGDES